MGETIKVPKTLIDVIRYFSDPATCVQFMAQLRWGVDGPVCPQCQSQRLSFLTTRLVWKCLDCKKQFSVKVGTIFEDSAIGLDKWLTAMWLIANCKNGVSSYEIAKDIAVTQKTAWFMLHRIRHAMQTGTFAKLSGEVEADETFIGGKAKNMHAMKKIRKYLAGELKHGGPVGKAIVMGVLQRNTTEDIPGTARKRSKQDSQVRPIVLAEVRKTDTDAHIKENVEAGAPLYTDDGQHYRYMPDYAHEFIDHAEAYVRGSVHTNGIENFWSLLKRSLAGTYVSVEPFHLQPYVDEQAFRFNKRNTTDQDRFVQLCSMVANRRLTWNELTGKDIITSRPDRGGESDA